MRAYGFPLIILFLVLILGCNDSQEKANEEPVPVSFGDLPYGKYKIILEHTNTKTATTYRNRSSGVPKSVVVENYSEWLLHHKDDTYTFELLDISYPFKHQLFTLKFDTRWDKVFAESNMPGYDVNVEDNGDSSFLVALEKLKLIKGFSFSLEKNADATESLYSLTSAYELPLESLTIEDNLYSPHADVQMHLAEKKIVPIFSLMLARPLKPMIDNEVYESTTGTWEWGEWGRNLTYKTGNGDTTTSMSMLNQFDQYNNLINSRFSSTSRSTGQKRKFRDIEIKTVNKYVNKAKLSIRAINTDNATGS